MENVRKVKVIAEANKAPRVEIDNYGGTGQINFADILFHAGRITLRLRNQCMRTPLCSNYATVLLNNNIDLFPKHF